MSGMRVFAGRLAGMIVLGPDGDSVGRVRDVAVSIYDDKATALGVVVELVTKRKIFLPMLRIGSITENELTMVSSSVNLRPFKARSGEISLMDDLLGAKVHTDDPEHPEDRKSVV